MMDIYHGFILCIIYFRIIWQQRYIFSVVIREFVILLVFTSFSMWCEKYQFPRFSYFFLSLTKANLINPQLGMESSLKEEWTSNELRKHESLSLSSDNAILKCIQKLSAVTRWIKLYDSENFTLVFSLEYHITGKLLYSRIRFPRKRCIRHLD